MRWVLWALLLANAGLLAWLARGENPDPSAPAVVPAADQVNRLLLLSEIGGDELRPRTAVALATETDQAQPPPRPEPGVCVSVGPVRSEEEAERMAAWLEERGGNARLRQNERREIALYWVFFAPLGSRAEAEARVRVMQEEAVQDIFIIQRGDMANAISLGVYSRRSSLERRLEELKSKGFEPSVVPRYRTKRATWYDARFEAGFHFPSDKFTLIFPAAQVIDTACEQAVAEAGQG